MEVGGGDDSDSKRHVVEFSRTVEGLG